jgi:hypothetical protein
MCARSSSLPHLDSFAGRRYFDKPHGKHSVGPAKVLNAVDFTANCFHCSQSRRHQNPTSGSPNANRLGGPAEGGAYNCTPPSFGLANRECSPCFNVRALIHDDEKASPNCVSLPMLHGGVQDCRSGISADICTLSACVDRRSDVRQIHSG